MIVLIDKKFNEQILLLKTFFPKIHIEEDIHKKTNLQIHSRGLRPPLKKASGGGAGIFICCLGHHSQTFSALKFLPAHFVFFFPHLPTQLT